MGANQMSNKCKECNGNGKIELLTSSKVCEACGGTGQEWLWDLEQAGLFYPVSAWKALRQLQEAIAEREEFFATDVNGKRIVNSAGDSFPLEEGPHGS
jgi:RecJ-like exonuclease